MLYKLLFYGHCSLGPDILARLEEVWRCIRERAGALAFVGIVLCSERCGLSVTSDADNHSQLPTVQECDECCAEDRGRTSLQVIIFVFVFVSTV